MSQPFLHDAAERIEYFREPGQPEPPPRAGEAVLRERAERLERQVATLQSEIDKRAAAQAALEERVAVLEWMARRGTGAC